MNKKLAIIVALAVVGVFAAVAVFQSGASETEFGYSFFPKRFRSQNLTAVYKLWKNEHNKTYGGVEDDKRYNVFAANFRIVQQVNALEKSFTLGLNQFADLTRAEFASLYLGLIKKNTTARALDEDVEIEELQVAADGAVDWRTKGAVTPVKNQQQCGSCWAFSTTGALEGLAFNKAGKLLSLSEQQLVDCAGSYGNQGCNGGLMDGAMKYTAAKGIETEGDYPYKGVDGNCKYVATKVAFKNRGYKAANGDSNLQAALNLGPVSVSVEADTSVFQLYSSGILNSKACGTNLDHGVLAVGYGVQGTQGYWIVKNSWGPTWGDKGYLKIARATGNGICGINMDNCYPTA